MNINEINRLRTEIDSIDREIFNKFIKRKELSDLVISCKNKLNLSIYDKQREIEIKSKLKDEFSHLINPIFIDNILNEILLFSKKDFLERHFQNINNIIDLINIKPFIIAGPCTVESREQINEIASDLNKLGIRILRGGAFKPRTSPFSFQGLEDEGLKYLKDAAEKNNMFVITEFTDSRQLDELYDYSDIIQIGSKNMFSYGFLKQIGKATSKDSKPVLIKRSFNATLNEFLLAAQYIINLGNPNVILCLRGIRTFEQIDSKMRFTPDLASILELKDMTNLKIVFDPSHACGDSKYVIPTAIAAINLGSDGVMLETHSSPETAISDGKQSIKPEELTKLIDYINHNY